MNTYVMSDIHGCYEDFLKMLDKIAFSESDSLILAGDYIDRGKRSFDMLKWIEHAPSNVLILRGNHEEEFASYVDLMLRLDIEEELESDFDSNKEAAALYGSVKYFLKNNGLPVSYFDLYGTLDKMLDSNGISINNLRIWTELIRTMLYYHKLAVGDRTCIVVHAGYTENLAVEGEGLENISKSFSGLEEFYMYAREEGYKMGGIRHGMIIAGHTPTIVEGEFTYNEGKVFRYYDKEKDCVFYDIDFVSFNLMYCNLIELN